MDFYLWCIGALLVGFISGGLFSGHNWKAYLKGKAHPNNRTPVFIDGSFYYVVPEAEFTVMWSLAHAQANEQ